MFIPDPGSWFLPIPDPGSKNSNKIERWKKISCHTFFVVTNFTKLNIMLFLKCLRQNLGQFSKNCWSFYPKNFQYALKYVGLGSGIRDPGSGKKPIPDPGVKKAPDPGSGSATLVLGIRIRRIHMFLSLLDPHRNPLVTRIDPAKSVRKTLISTVF